MALLIPRIFPLTAAKRKCKFAFASKPGGAPMTAEAAYASPAPAAPVHPLRNRSFVVWWLGATTSLLGDQFYLVALPWVVLQLTGSAGGRGEPPLCWGVPRA